MRRRSPIYRTVALLAVGITALAGVVLPASPASARPIDCSLTAVLYQSPAGLQASGQVYCSTPETYNLMVYLYRRDFLVGTVVAQAVVGRNNYQGYTTAYAVEPCSALQTNKQYDAKIALDDTRFGPGIRVKEIITNKVWGHC
ncbi:hypothetical protein [Asanoa iriomotensis]|uniref:Secreted protein n=1 Tax=Asanoa iriomotensis TaxID=234613 RepID=A0ABQ4C0Z1_9ACTN|nr:hypothetical protein [Asanoa iriomotensis]GIF56450.1 hypothetical protein Air01nite_25450 [Asanoa iriomotensis]